MRGRDLAALLFLAGLGALLASVMAELGFGNPPLRAGGPILEQSPSQVGAANIVTSVVLAYRGMDTLVELTILFTAATAAGMVLGQGTRAGRSQSPAGFILSTAADALFPFLLVLGAYIILHGHLTPGGGFQGGTILAVAFFLPLLAQPNAGIDERITTWVEGSAGAAFLLIALAGLAGDGFMAPFPGGELGELLSAGSLPVLYLALGLKVGAELAGLMGRLLTEDEA